MRADLWDSPGGKMVLEKKKKDQRGARRCLRKQQVAGEGTRCDKRSGPRAFYWNLRLPGLVLDQKSSYMVREWEMQKEPLRQSKGF